MPKPIPEGYHTATPMIMFKDARRAIEFYKQAFGAVERYVVPGPDGKGVMHAEIMIGDSIIMMGDENPDMPGQSAETLGGSPVSFYLYFENADEAFDRAVKAGAMSRMEVADMFWGDRMGAVQDPFGFGWSIATHVKDMTQEEMDKAARKAFGKAA